MTKQGSVSIAAKSCCVPRAKPKSRLTFSGNVTTATPTNTIATIAPAIAMSSKLIISPNPAALYTSLTDRCFSFTNQRAPAANAHKTSPTVPHTQTQKDEYFFIQPHNTLTSIARLHICPGTHCQHHHRDNSDNAMTTATTMMK